MVIQGASPNPDSNPVEVINQKITYQPKPVPDFEVEVLKPLRQKQQEKAIQDAQEAARLAEVAKQQQLQAQAASSVITPSKTAVTRPGGDAWALLRQCEAGGNYAANTGNGYYGAYQYNIQTWANYGGYSRPDLAPPDVQDAKARETQAARGWSPWPSCARKLGLL